MKKFVLAAVLVGMTLVVSSFAQAQMFSLNAKCQFNQATGRCIVFNNLPQPVFCSIKASGQTASGAYMNVFNNVWVGPGQQAWAVVNANNPYQDPLVGVYGTANCHF